MNCDEIQLLMADALGGELSASNRARLESHLAECPRCRKDLASSRDALDEIRTMPAPVRVRLRREGRHFVAEPIVGSGFSANLWQRTSAWRRAASIIIAFTAGYALHAGLMLTRTGPAVPSQKTQHVTSTAASRDDSFDKALVLAHQRNPLRSDMAKYMGALFTSTP